MRRTAMPIRWRLALWHGASVLLATAACGLLAYGLARRELIRHHDGSLQRTAASVEGVLREREDCHALATDQVERLDQIGRLVLVHDIEGHGTIFYRSPDTVAFPVPFDLSVGESVLLRGPWFETHDAGDSGSVMLVRVLSVPYQSRQGRHGLIRVMDPLGDVDATLGSLKTAFLLAVPLALVAAVMGGFLFSRRALAPVDGVTKRARAIEAGALHQRLPVHPVDDEIGRLVETLNDMFGRLERSFEGMRRFTADASHELRTPLAAMRATLDAALARARDAGDDRAALASLAEDVDLLRVLVEDLLTLARADAGRADLARQPVRLDTVAREVVDTLQPVADEQGAALVVTASPATVRGDERWLRQLLMNLCANALAHGVMPGRELRVEVEVRIESGSAVLTVKDNGPGLPEEMLPRIFERFFRIESARSRDSREGAGLGLAIASWIVEAHGGTMSALLPPGGGLALVARIPLG